MLKESIKISYLRKIEGNEPLFPSETKDWLRKQVRLFLNKADYKGNFLNNESVNDYILKELVSKGFIEEKDDGDNNPNNHFKLTQKWKHFLKEYQTRFWYKIELWLSDHQIISTNLLALLAVLLAFASLIVSIIALKK